MATESIQTPMKGASTSSPQTPTSSNSATSTPRRGVATPSPKKPYISFSSPALPSFHAVRDMFEEGLPVERVKTENGTSSVVSDTVYMVGAGDGLELEFKGCCLGLSAKEPNFPINTIRRPRVQQNIVTIPFADDRVLTLQGEDADDAWRIASWFTVLGGIEGMDESEIPVEEEESLLDADEFISIASDAADSVSSEAHRKSGSRIRDQIQRSEQRAAGKKRHTPEKLSSHKSQSAEVQPSLNSSTPKAGSAIRDQIQRSAQRAAKEHGEPAQDDSTGQQTVTKGAVPESPAPQVSDPQTTESSQSMSAAIPQETSSASSDSPISEPNRGTTEPAVTPELAVTPEPTVTPESAAPETKASEPVISPPNNDATISTEPSSTAPPPPPLQTPEPTAQVQSRTSESIPETVKETMLQRIARVRLEVRKANLRRKMQNAEKNR